MEKYRDRNGRCIAILFKSVTVRGRSASREIWEGDERRRLESGDSLNGLDLFSELPFLQSSLPQPSFTEPSFFSQSTFLH